VAHLALGLLDRAMHLKQGGGRRTHRAEVEVRDPSGFGNRLHDALEEVADPVSRAGLGWEEERLWIVLVGMLRHPCMQIPSEVRRHADPRVRGLGFGFTTSILPLLLFLYGFINSQPTGLDILDSQGEQFRRAQSAEKKDAKNKILARDTRLDRTVAVKVLPARLAHDTTSREQVVAELKLAVPNSMAEEKLNTTWGIFDTEDGVWLGDHDGPATFAHQDLAQIGARMADVRLRQTPGRCRAKELPAEILRRLRYRDEKPAFMTGEEALRGLEEGRSFEETDDRRRRSRPPRCVLGDVPGHL